ncbi:MAG: hypothetical protein Fur003_4250 [Candidatus Dojkabacteria bacterium]
MSLFLKYTVPESKNGDAVEVFHYEAHGGGLMPQMGSLTCLLTLKSEKGGDLHNVSRFVWNSIVEKYKYYEGSTLQALKASLQTGTEKLRDLIKNDETYSESGIDFEITILSINEANLYVAFLGNHQLILSRGAETTSILDLLKEHKVSSGSVGFLPSDILLLTDKGVDDTFQLTKENLSKLINSPKEAEGAYILISQSVDFEQFVDVPVDEYTELLEEVVEEEGTNPKQEKAPVEETKTSVANEEIADLETAGTLPDTDATYDTEATTEDETETINASENMKEDEIDVKQPLLETDELPIETAQPRETELESEELTKKKDTPLQGIISKLGGLTSFKKNKSAKILDDGEELDSEIENDTSLSDETSSIEESSSTPNKLMKVTSGVANLGNRLKTTSSTIITKARPAAQKTGSLFNKLGAAIAKVFSKLKQSFLGMLSTKYGRKPWFKRFMAKFTQSEFGTSRLGKLRVGGYRTSALRNKRVLYVIIGIVLILVVFWGIKATKEANAKRYIHTQFTSYYEKVDDLISEAEGKIKTDKDAAEIGLFNANEELAKLPVKEDSLSAEDKALLTQLRSKVLSIEDQLYNRTLLVEGSNNISLFIDGKLSFGKDTAPSDIAIKRDSLLTEYLYIVDEGSKAIYQVTTSDATVKKIEDPENLIKDPLYVDIGVEGAYIYDKSAGALKAPYKDNTGSLTAIKGLSGVAPDDFGVTEASEFAVFTSLDNLYLLSQDRGSIMKSQRASGVTYGLPYTYFADDSFTTATDIFGDFSIYILSSGSEGLKTYSYDSSIGQLVNTETVISGLREPLQNLTAGYTGESLDNMLYVFDSTGKRIIVFEKPNTNLHQGQLLYKKEYVYRGNKAEVFEQVKDIVVDSAESKMYILDSTKVWQISL